MTHPLTDTLRRLTTTTETHLEQALRRAADWSGHLGATPTNGGGSRSQGGHSDPTATTATTKPHDHRTRQLRQELQRTIRELDHKLHHLEQLIQQCQPNKTERDTTNELDAINTRAGWCTICADHNPNRHWHDGIGSNRLRPITTGEWIDGALHTPLVCTACYHAWRRRPDDDRGAPIGYDEWATLRAAWLQLGCAEEPPSSAVHDNVDRS